MRLLLVLFSLFLLGLCDFPVKKYQIDLDVEPRLRWKEIVEDHKDYLPAVAEESKLVFLFSDFFYIFKSLKCSSC